MADRILSPEEVAYRARYGQDTLQGGRQMAQAPRHWAQALAGALQMGLGGHYGANAAFQEKEGKASANKMLADALMGGAAPKDVAAQMMSNPWAADAGRALAVQSMQPSKPTDDMREYNLAQSQGFKGSFMDFDTARRSASAARTNVNMPGMETAYDKSIGTKLAEEFVKSQEGAGKAAQAIADLRVMEAAANNPNVYTGTGGGAIQGVKKAAQTLFGVDVRGVPEGEIIQRTTAKIALSLKDNLPGPMSNSDRDFLMELPPGLTTSPEGMRRILKLGMAQRKWEIERGQVARQFAARNGGRLTPQYYSVVSEVDQKYADIMGGLSKELQSQVQAAPRAPTAGTPAAEAYAKQYGLKLGPR